jgi:hypothetical protein
MEFDKFSRMQSLNEKTYTVRNYGWNIAGKMDLGTHADVMM